LDQENGKNQVSIRPYRVDTIRRFNKSYNATWNYCPTASTPPDLLSL
jgi:hypothetical protein